MRRNASTEFRPQGNEGYQSHFRIQPSHRYLQMSMPNLSRVCALALLMLGGALVVLAQDENTAKSKVDALIRLGLRDDIGRIDVFRLRDSFVNVVAVRPYDMERIWHYKMTIREPSVDREELIVGILKAAKLVISNRAWDLRWG